MKDNGSGNTDGGPKLQFKDPETPPTDGTLSQTLGAAAYAAYEAFQDALPRLDIEQEWQWYAPNKAWFGRGWHWWTSARGTRKEKTLYWLYVFEGSFHVAVWFKQKNRAEAVRENVSEKTRRLIAGSETFGKVPTFPVEFEINGSEPLADVFTLIKCKKRLET